MKSAFTYFPARIIASAAKCCAKTIHRRAARENWPVKKGGIHFKYQPPVGLHRKCLSIVRRTKQAGLRGFNITAEMRAGKLRADLRFAAISALDQELKSGAQIERALARVARSFSTFHATKISVRKWQAQYKRHGLAGLLEKKLGRVGGGRKVKR